MVLLSAQARQKTPPGSATQLQPHSAGVDASRRAGVRQDEGASAGIIEDEAAAIQALRILEIETRLTLRATEKSHRSEIVETCRVLANEAVGVGGPNRIVPIVFEKCTAPTQ